MVVSVDSANESELMVVSVELEDESERMVAAVSVFFPKGIGHGSMQKKCFFWRSVGELVVGEMM